MHQHVRDHRWDDELPDDCLVPGRAEFGERVGRVARRDVRDRGARIFRGAVGLRSANARRGGRGFGAGAGERVPVESTGPNIFWRRLGDAGAAWVAVAARADRIDRPVPVDG